MKMAEVMAFKLMIEAQRRWHKIRGSEEITHLLNGGVYKDGELIQSPVADQRGGSLELRADPQHFGVPRKISFDPDFNLAA